MLRAFTVCRMPRAAEGELSVPLVSIDARFLFASDARRATLPEGKKLQRRQSLQSAEN